MMLRRLIAGDSASLVFYQRATDNGFTVLGALSNLFAFNRA
jgi:hypothetical protein